MRIAQGLRVVPPAMMAVVVCALLLGWQAPGTNAAGTGDVQAERPLVLAPLAAGTADIKLQSQNVSFPTSFNAGEPVNLLVNKTVHNNGPDTVAVTVTNSVALPSDCTVGDLGPGGTQILNGTMGALALSTPTPFVETETVVCSAAGDHQIQLTNCVAPPMGTTDPNMANNCAIAVLSFQVDDGDLIPQATEIGCGSDQANPASTPERNNGIDDDGDLAVDEALPGTAPSQDCDGDGFSGAAESGTPLCGNGVDDDSSINGGVPDDSIVDDGCPGGPTQAGAFSEAQFKIGTNDQVTCQGNGWPLELFTGMGSVNQVTLQDLTSFTAMPRRFGTSPGHPDFNSRWDLLPGRGVFLDWINLQDFTALLAGATASPRFHHGQRSFGNATCRDQMHNILVPNPDQTPLRGRLYVGNLSWGAVDSSGAAEIMIASQGRAGRGLAQVDVADTYNSRITLLGPLGQNWESPHNQRLLVQPSGNVMRADGSGRGDWYLFQTNGSFRAPSGSYTTLVRNSNGTYDERFPDGTLIEYNAARAGLARIGFIRDRFGNQVTYNYNADDLLSSVRDDLGRSTAYGYNAQGLLNTVTDPSGRISTFAYTPALDLETATGPAVTGTPTGNDFPAGKTTRFTYSSGMSDPRMNHNMLTIKAPEEVALGGGPRAQLIYSIGQLNFDRVTSATVGGTNGSGVPAGGTTTFAYTVENPSPPTPLNDLYWRVTTVDPNGNQKEYDLSRRGYPVAVRELSNRDIRAGDPASWVTARQFTAEGELALETMPEGNTVAYTYDSANANRLAQGNVLSVQYNPDPDRGGDQTMIRNSFFYEPIYNQVRLAIDPRGNDPAFVPPLGVQSAARYTTRYRFDYEEGCDFAAMGTRIGRSDGYVQQVLADAGMCLSPAGDLNLDSNTTQVSGSAIIVQEPSVQLVDDDSLLDTWESEQAIDLDCNNLVDDDGDGYIDDGCPANGSPESGSQCDNSTDDDGDTVVNDGCPPVQIQVEMVQLNLFGQPVLATDPESNVTTLEYYPETDPNGDGTIDCAVCNSVTGGYLKQLNVDTSSDPQRESGSNPTPVNIRNRYLYDARGNIIRAVDGRGVATDYSVNQLDQVVQVSRAAAVNVFTPDPPEPLAPTADAFLERYWYDHNDRLVLRQVEDRGNTRGVDGNLPSGELPAVAPNPDPVGGPAFDDTVFKYTSATLDQLFDQVSGLDVTFSVKHTKFYYDRNGNLALVRSPVSNLGSGDSDLQLSNVWSAVYDERNMLATSTRGGTTTQWQALEANDDIPGGASIPNSSGIATSSMAYNGNGAISLTTDPEDTDAVAGAETTTYMYDGFDRRVSEVDAAGGQSFHQYDPAGNMVSSRFYGPVGGATPTSNSAATFSQPLSPGSFTQQQLSRRDYKYDEVGRSFESDGHLYACNGSTPACMGVTYVRPPVIIDGPLGGTNDGMVVSRRDYDRLGRSAIALEDFMASGAGDQLQYDGAGRIVRSVDSTNTIESNNAVYDDNDNLRSMDLIERSTSGIVPPVQQQFTDRYLYDSVDRRVRAVDPLGNTRSMAYDTFGYMVAWSDAQNNTLISDPTGQYPGMINQPGNTGSNIYDGLGRRVAAVADLRVGGTGAGVIDTSNASNPDGRVVADTKYDINGRARASADDGSVSGDNNTSIGLIENSSPLGNVTRVVYDDLNRPTVWTYDDGTTRSVMYDRDDNVTQETDQNGSVFAYSYDALNRVRQVAVTPGSGVANRSTLKTYQYDALDRMVRTTDNNDPAMAPDDSTVEVAYDSLGRMLEERQQTGTGSPAVVSSRYDGSGRRVALIYPTGRQIDYEYDSLSRLVLVQDSAEPQPTATFAYIGSRLLERQNRNPLTGNFTVRLTMRNPTTGVLDGYDGDGRAVRVRHVNSVNAALADFVYTYDRMGNRTQEQRQHANRMDTYSYDSLYRLTQFQRDAQITPPLPGMFTGYTLDGNGNWDNQATDNNMNEYSVFQGKSRTYDNNGNLLMSGTMPTEYQYQYDAWNRLTQVSTGGGAMQVDDYRYDATGRPTSKTVTNSGAFNGSFSYFSDGGQTIRETDSAGSSRDYVTANPGPLQSPGIALRMDSSPLGQTRFMHEDGRGNASLMTDVNQQPLERYDYDAYGVPTFKNGSGVNTGAQASANGNPWLFGGMYWEGENRLYSAGECHDPGCDDKILEYSVMRDVDIDGWGDNTTASYKPDEGRTLTSNSGSSMGSGKYTYAGGNPASLPDWECRGFTITCQPSSSSRTLLVRTFRNTTDITPSPSHAHGHLDFLKQVGDPAFGKEKFVRDKPHVNIGGTTDWDFIRQRASTIGYDVGVVSDNAEPSGNQYRVKVKFPWLAGNRLYVGNLSFDTSNQSSGSDKRKQSLYFPEDMLVEMKVRPLQDRVLLNVGGTFMYELGHNFAIHGGPSAGRMTKAQLISEIADSTKGKDIRKDISIIIRSQSGSTAGDTATHEVGHWMGMYHGSGSSHPDFLWSPIGTSLAGSRLYVGGLSWGTADTTGDGRAEVMATAGLGGEPGLVAFDALSAQLVDPFFSLASSSSGRRR